METYQKVKRFTLRLRQDQIDKLKEIAEVEMETSSEVIRKFINQYELPKTFNKERYESITWVDPSTGVETELPYVGKIKVKN